MGKKSSNGSFSESVKNYTNAISRIYLQQEKKKTLIPEKEVHSTSIENAIQTGNTPKNQSQKDMLNTHHRKVNSVVLKSPSNKIEFSSKPKETVYERKYGETLQNKFNIYKPKTLTTKEVKKNNNIIKSLNKIGSNGDIENEKVENKIEKIYKEKSPRKVFNILSNLSPKSQIHTQNSKPEIGQEESLKKELGFEEPKLRIGESNFVERKNLQSLEEKIESIKALSIRKKRNSFSCVLFAAKTDLFSELSQTDLKADRKSLTLIKKEISHSVAGDIVIPSLRAKMFLNKENFRQSSYFLKKKMPKPKNDLQKNKFLNKLQFSTKSSQFKYKPSKFQYEKEEPKQLNSLENDFLKTFNQILTGNKVLPPSTPRNRNNPNRPISNFSNLSQRITLKNLACLDPLQYEDLFKNDSKENSRDLDQETSLAHQPQITGAENFSSYKSKTKLLRRELNSNNAFTIEITPPIEEVGSDLEESCKNSNSAKSSLDKINTNRTVRQTYDVSYRPEMMSSFSGIYRNLRETSSLSNSHIEDKNISSQVFREKSEEIFQFDQIFPSHFSNLNVNSQKLRMKGNFFSFIEKLTHPLILNAEGKLNNGDEDLQRSFSLYNFAKKSVYSSTEYKDNDVTSKAFDETLTQEEVGDLLLLFGRNSEKENQGVSGFHNDMISEEDKAEKDLLTLIINEVLFQRPYSYQGFEQISKLDKVSQITLFSLTELRKMKSFNVNSLWKVLVKKDKSETLVDKQKQIFEAIGSLNRENYHFLKKMILSYYGQRLYGSFENLFLVDEISTPVKNNEKKTLRYYFLNL